MANITISLDEPTIAYLQHVAIGGLSVEAQAAMLVEYCVRNKIEGDSEQHRVSLGSASDSLEMKDISS